MYNNYTPLQQRQLALQEYSNTQSTYLLVCAPARSTALKATLTDQLHRKFRLVDRLGGELTASVDGVLLAAEDVELDNYKAHENAQKSKKHAPPSKP